MATIERYLKIHTKTDASEVGVETVEALETASLISTRPFLTVERMQKPRRRGSVQFPHIISTNGLNYVLDGHHKARIQMDAGAEVIRCRVLYTENQILARRLERMARGFLGAIPIRPPRP